MSSLARYLDPAVIQRMGRLDLRARFIVEGFLAGLHASPWHGLSLEFSEHRKYVPGDDLRSIDWNVFARTDRLYLRRHHAETHLACHVLIDASASMDEVGPVDRTRSSPAPAGTEPAGSPSGASAEPEGPASAARGADPHFDAGPDADQSAESSKEGAMTKLDYAVHLAAALAYLVTRQHDAIGLAIIGERVRSYVPPRARRDHLLAILAELSNAAALGRTGLAAGVHEAVARIAHRGLIVVISDLLADADACMRAFHHIRFRGHDLIVMHVLDAAEVRFPFRGPLRLEDPETGRCVLTDADAVRQRYVEAVTAWRSRLQEQVAGLRADYVPLDTATPFDRALTEFLAQRDRRV